MNETNNEIPVTASDSLTSNRSHETHSLLHFSNDLSPIVNPDCIENEFCTDTEDSDDYNSKLHDKVNERPFKSSTPSVERMNNIPDLNIKVKLESKSLWDEFNKIGTEMIITKFGRRMFPILKISVEELEPLSKYIILLDIIPIDNNKYKYINSKWNITDRSELHSTGRFYIHPDSPATGTHWMKKDIHFQKVKVTNNLLDRNGYIILNTMHKYIMRLHVVKTNDILSLKTSHFNTFSFNETKFIAITAYQNDKVRQLKIKNNPFAKGFRNNKPDIRADDLIGNHHLQTEYNNNNLETNQNAYNYHMNIQNNQIPFIQAYNNDAKVRHLQKFTKMNSNISYSTSDVNKFEYVPYSLYTSQYN